VVVAHSQDELGVRTEKRLKIKRFMRKRKKPSF